MAFYADRLILHPAMENPTIVVITDRNDLDDQLFTTFARCRDLFAAGAGTGREPRRSAREAAARGRRRRVHDNPEGGRQEKLKTKWAQLEVLVGSANRVGTIARDLVAHFEERLAAMDGKAMIVCMSRRICVDLYRELVALRPDWEHADDDKGVLKVVMTGSAADAAAWQPHIRNKARREALANRFRDPNDAFRIVIVRDMWLTGFDAPSLHTMYVDKPMRGHGLMQAIARVNRVFKDKPGGLVVDYLGLADELKQALATYTESGGSGRTAIDQ
jgi:type I restriction enzyme R subunit